MSVSEVFQRISGDDKGVPCGFRGVPRGVPESLNGFHGRPKVIQVISGTFQGGSRGF